MSRELGADALASMFAPSTSKVWLHLITIDHDDMPTPLRVVDNTEDVVSRGNTYVACPFDVSFPKDDGIKLPSVRIRLGNVDQSFTEALRSVSDPPTVTMEIILTSAPDVVEAGPLRFVLKSIAADIVAIDGQLGYEEILQEAYPGDIFSATLFPGLWP